MNIAVCDNDKNICEDIVNLIRKQNPAIKIFSFTSGDELLKCKEEFAIIFLDIKGISGMNIARILRFRQEIQGSMKSILIFVTGYREYMEEAFDVHAFHYLLKPIDTKKFVKVLECALKEAEAIENEAENYLLIKVIDTNKKIPLKDILFIESQNKKVVIHTSDKIYETYGKMDAFEIALGDLFYRCHRCYLVNLEKISAYQSDTIHLINDEKILLARKKYSDFVKTYLRYAIRGGIVNV